MHKMGCALVGLVCAFATGVAEAHVSLTNDLAIMTLDGKGLVRSLKVRADDAELATGAGFFCTMQTQDGKFHSPAALDVRKDGRLAFHFTAVGGDLVFEASSFGGGWTFKVVECTVPTVKTIFLGRITPSCTKYRGGLANMLSDDDHGVCLRAYQTKGRMRCGGELVINVDRARGLDGFEFGLVVARRSDLVPALRKMTMVAGAPHTVNGGAWSLGAEGNRGSYCFADLWAFSVDDWIDFALRGGFSTIHMHGWWKTRGHYGFNESQFPNGETDWKNVCARIHAAGLKVGMHCLTGAVQPRDEWATPHCREELLDWCTVTLSKDLAPTDTVMYVEEPVDIDHFNTFHSYSSRGNTFRAGQELIQYRGVLDKKPYGFTGVIRGAWRSEKGGVIPAGTKLHYLYQRYDAFYPQPDSKLAGELATAIGAKRDLGNVDQIYLDGAEAVREDFNYTEDRYREQIVGKLDKGMLIEGSNGDAFTWWYLSRYGAWDRPFWGMKRMHDDHLLDVENARKMNLLEAQMGWWHPEVGAETHPGHKLDEMEYFAARNAAVDTASSTQGTDVSSAGALQCTVVQQITLLGWYERFRLSRAFSDAALAKLAKPRQETRLRQDQYYGWRLFSCDPYFHRVTGLNDTQKWTWNVKTKPNQTGLRVEALYYADTASTNRVKLLKSSDVAQLKQPYKNKDVTCRFAAGKDAKVGPTLVIDAKSTRETSRNAELCLMREWTKQPYFNAKGCYAFGAWVKGDGSGADLWFVVESAKLYSWNQSFHRVKLDFTGWRKFLFPLRERDISEAYEYGWREGLHPMVTCAGTLNMEHLGSFRVYLNELPPNKDVHVEVSEVVAMPAMKKTVKRSGVKFGQTIVPVPFEMTSGEFAELEEGRWTLYDEGGQVIGQKAGSMPTIAAGENAVQYGGETTDGEKARAEVTLFAQHSPVAALKPIDKLNADQKKAISYEAVMPSVYRPAKGVTALEPIYVRPGEKARLSMTIYGPIKKPTLSFCGEKWTFDVDIPVHSRLYCKDGLNWRLVDKTRKTLATGRLAKKLPVLMGGKTVLSISCEEPQKAASRIEMVKHYTDEPSYYEEHQINVKSSIDGTMQPSYFFPAPNASPTNRAPLLVLFHTWSYHMWELTEIYHSSVEDCRKRGWALLCPEFRGPNDTPQGCGSDLATGDIKDAIDWVKAHYPIDDDRVYAMGGSGGGHMTLLLAGRYPEIWAGCAAFCPPADFLEWHPASKALGHCYWRHLEQACGGTPEEKRAEYIHRSPITYAKTIRDKGVNVMIITGVHDGILGKGTVPVSVPAHMYNAMADEKDRVSEDLIRYMAKNESAPADEIAKYRDSDPFYGKNSYIHVRKTSGNVQLTIFEGAHGGNGDAAIWWLARQRRGVSADWSLPKEAKGGYKEFTK